VLLAVTAAAGLTVAAVIGLAGGCTAGGVAVGAAVGAVATAGGFDAATGGCVATGGVVTLRIGIAVVLVAVVSLVATTFGAPAVAGLFTDEAVWIGEPVEGIPLTLVDIAVCTGCLRAGRMVITGSLSKSVAAFCS
jgi:hypothetical protein